MKKLASRSKLITGTVILLMITGFINHRPSLQQAEWVVVIHGGAGNITHETLDSLAAQRYREALNRALLHGRDVLDSGGTALDVVEQVIIYMEDCPLFNAGRGAVFTASGINELDASIMDGLTGNAGAIAGVSNIRNPIKAARLVMEHSPHVMLSGRGAEEFAEENDLPTADTTWFRTGERWKSYLRAKEKLDKNGTVGVVCLDKAGNLAAGTSTGGMNMKAYGRIGDSPVIGAGTYADNNTCAVSCTGHGEYFIRNVVAYDITARMKYLKQSLREATDTVVYGVLKQQKATGGLIAVDKNGNIAMPYNTSGMFRGYIKSDGTIKVMIFGDE